LGGGRFGCGKGGVKRIAAGGSIAHGCRPHHGGRQAGELVGEIAVGRHGGHLILPEIQELLGQIGEIDRRCLLGHCDIIGRSMQSSQCSYRIAKGGLKPAMLCIGRLPPLVSIAGDRSIVGEAQGPHAQRQRRIEFDGCRQRHGQRQDTGSD
jgi:hypothetical protein